MVYDKKSCRVYSEFCWVYVLLALQKDVVFSVKEVGFESADSKGVVELLASQSK